MRFAKYSVEDLVHYNYFNNINYSLFSQSTAIVSRIILINMVFFVQSITATAPLSLSNPILYELYNLYSLDLCS